MSVNIDIHLIKGVIMEFVDVAITGGGQLVWPRLMPCVSAD
ncbi:hypothetical protein [Streptomyces bathyalis]|nr:hypothetical protein [Streptomyces bathyalis]